MKKLPIGISTFSQIREEGYCYVDKTGFVNKLAEGGKYFFISRPRRFGKSLFIDTLREAFSCNKKLFTGLALENVWNWERPYPVIHISFGGGVIKSRTELDTDILFQLSRISDQEGLKTGNDRTNLLFRELITSLSGKYHEKVVILIDEYDKPILDNITNPDAAREIREGLKNFYSVIKDSDAYVQFCLLTGVSKFSKVSLFSGLNNLQDITLDARYGTLCGYTQSDLETVFAEHLPGVDLAGLKCWYNGYCFDGESVYNPFDVLLYLDQREFKNYWFETGTPTFLIDLLGRRQFLAPDLEKLVAGDALIGSFDVDQIEPETLLFQTGYLTIKEKQQVGGAIMYELSFPNLEVKMSLTDHILASLSGAPAAKDKMRHALYQALLQGEPDVLRPIFQSFFSSIPHDWYRKNELAGYEGYYASIFYCYFTALGLDVLAEDATNKGRLDMRVKLGKRIFIFEFKVVELVPEGNALAQLQHKRYHEKYVNDGCEIFLIGVEFSKADRNIVKYEWVRQ